MVAVSSPALSLFYCYAHEDASLRAALDKHLAMLKRLGLIESWSDLDISAGTERQEAMDHYLSTADILLLLISADFLASDYCYSIAMQQALQRHQAGEAVVIPIIVRPVEWEQTPLRALQALPRDGRPVTQWGRRDQAWKQIAAEIRIVVEALRRPVVVDSSPQLHPIAAHLISFLAVHGIPARSIEHVPEATKLHETIRESSAVVLIASSEMPSARTLKKTQNLAAIYQCPVLGIWVADTDQGENHDVAPPKEWSGYISIDQEPERQEEAFQKLLRHLKQLRHHSLFPVVSSSLHALVPLTEPRNPYKGLRAFTSNDTRDFFGRTALIDELARSVETMLTLAKKTGQHARLLAVVGPSGSGKSSVIMAGLLPCLRTGEIFDSEAWVYLDPLVVGEHPLEALALTLFEHFPEKSLQMLRDDLQDDSARGLHLYATALARRTKSSSTYVVLVVDQFEELFTLTTNEQERQQFIDLLVTACTQRGGPLIVILTLRADFYDRPMQYPALYTLIEQHQVAMLPMTQNDLRAVITQPAMLPDVQLTFEGSLVGDLLFDIQGQIGALPLLQFTLDQLFQQRAGHQLTLQAYHDMGGVKGALSHHAEQTYQDLPSPEHHTNARALFLRLIDPGFTEQDATRRRAPLSEFKFTSVTQTQCMQETIEAFVQARLLTTKQSGDKTTIEVSHEAVIREWKRLADWLREARDDIHFQQAFSEDVAEWEHQKQPKDRLYRGIQLKEAQAWAKRNTPSAQEAAFLHASAVQYTLLFVRSVVIVLLLAPLLSFAGWYAFFRPNPTFVSTLADNNNPGSLRYAINEASPGSTIKFDPSLRGKTIMLTSGDLSIAKNLTILGLGADSLSISSGKRGYIIHVVHDVIVNISGLSFKDSKTNINSFVYNEDGRLTLSNCKVWGNTWQGAGGGIDNSGTLTLNNSIVSDNMSPDAGGGIDNSGTLTLNNSIVSDNISQGGGGGIFNNDGIITLNNSTVSGNTMTGQFNSGSGIGGGGIFNDGGTIMLNNSTISSNTAAGQFSGGAVFMSYSIVLDNMATEQYNDGGGLYSNQGVIELNNSTVSDNIGGGIFIDSSILPNLSKSSIAQVDLTFSTIYNNTAHYSDDIAIEDYSFSKGQYIRTKQYSQVKISNSIVAGDPAHSGPDILGTLTSYGYNLFQSNSGATFDPATSKLHSNDKTLSPNDLDKLFANSAKLQNNGGPTKTFALAPSSPAIDQIPLAACHITIPPIKDMFGRSTAQYTITTDQRGKKRPDDGENKCDIGAYEYQPPD